MRKEKRTAHVLLHDTVPKTNTSTQTELKQLPALSEADGTMPHPRRRWLLQPAVSCLQGHAPSEGPHARPSGSLSANHAERAADPGAAAAAACPCSISAHIEKMAGRHTRTRCGAARRQLNSTQSEAIARRTHRIDEVVGDCRPA